MQQSFTRLLQSAIYAPLSFGAWSTALTADTNGARIAFQEANHSLQLAAKTAHLRTSSQESFAATAGANSGSDASKRPCDTGEVVWETLRSESDDAGLCSSLGRESSPVQAGHHRTFGANRSVFSILQHPMDTKPP